MSFALTFAGIALIKERKFNEYARLDEFGEERNEEGKGEISMNYRMRRSSSVNTSP